MKAKRQNVDIKTLTANFDSIQMAELPIADLIEKGARSMWD